MSSHLSPQQQRLLGAIADKVQQKTGKPVTQASLTWLHPPSSPNAFPSAQADWSELDQVWDWVDRLPEEALDSIITEIRQILLDLGLVDSDNLTELAEYVFADILLSEAGGSQQLDR